MAQWTSTTTIRKVLAFVGRFSQIVCWTPPNAAFIYYSRSVFVINVPSETMKLNKKSIKKSSFRQRWYERVKQFNVNSSFLTVDEHLKNGEYMFEADVSFMYIDHWREKGIGISWRHFYQGLEISLVCCFIVCPFYQARWVLYPLSAFVMPSSVTMT